MPKEKKQKEMSEKAIELFYSALKKDRPAPKGELIYKDPYTLLVAVVLSAQATDKGVNKATPALFAKADTPEKMLALGEEKLMEHIKTIGLYKTKGRNIMALSQMLLDRFEGVVPRTAEALEMLPGVGRKSANVVLSIAFGQKTIAVDTHVFRVSNRTGLARGKNVREVEDALMKRTPAPFLKHAHHWLILHGRYVCKARAPQCPACLVRDVCLFEGKV